MFDDYTVVLFAAFLFVLMIIGLAWLAMVVEREFSQGDDPWNHK